MFVRDYTRQGSIIAIVGNDGSATTINSYDPWGVPGPANQGLFQYTGQVWLPELGMYYYKARIYWAALGRFLQVDPVGYKDQNNLYAYVGNDPMNHVDPDGKILAIIGDEKYRRAVLQQIRTLQSRPSGRALVNRLVLSKNVHIMQQARKDDPLGARTDPRGPSRNGIGDGSTVQFDPNNRRVSESNRDEVDPYVKLGHELGHSWDMDQGRDLGDMGSGQPGTTPSAERNSMLWENAIRKEHGLKERPSYYPALPN